MYGEFSKKKIFAAFLLIFFIFLGLILVFVKERNYLEGFSLDYYLKTFRNKLLVFVYRFEFSRVKNLSLTSSISDAFWETYSIEGNPADQALSIPVLLYHGVLEGDEKNNVTKSRFKEHMFALKSAGYETVSIYDFADFLRGEKALPPKSFLLTFDDGRKDSYYPVDPILEALDYEATLFVITRHSIGEENRFATFYLSSWELDRINQNPRWQIQSHGRDAHSFYPIDAAGSLGHFFSNKLWKAEEGRLETDAEFAARVEEDMRESKQEIEESLKKPVISLAFPFGEFAQEQTNFSNARDILLSAAKPSYPLLFYQLRGETEFRRNYPIEDAFLVKRISVDPLWTGEDLLWAFRTSEDKPLVYEDNLDSDEGWLTSWGSTRFADQNLVVEATSTTNGAFTVLEGTYLWKNYRFETQGNLNGGDALGLIARYRDENNYLICKFSANHASLEEVSLGLRLTLATVNRSFPIHSDSSFQTGIEVISNRASCLWENEKVISNQIIRSTQNHGGIGLIISGQELNSAEFITQSINVQAIQ